MEERDIRRARKQHMIVTTSLGVGWHMGSMIYDFGGSIVIIVGDPFAFSNIAGGAGRIGQHTRYQATEQHV